jgi:hypothetical protein
LSELRASPLTPLTFNKDILSSTRDMGLEHSDTKDSVIKILLTQYIVLNSIKKSQVIQAMNINTCTFKGEQVSTWF